MNAARLRLTVCVVLAGLGTFVHRSAEGNSLAQTQLAGLKGVNLMVTVSRDVPGADALENEIRAQTKEVLARGALSDDGPDGVWLSIDVTVHPSGEKLRAEDVLVQVKIELSERVRLNRNRSIKLPQGAVTWSEESISIESKSDLREYVMKQVDWGVGLFADSVKTIRRLPDKAVHDRGR